MHAKRQEIKQHKKSWSSWWQSSKCVNSEIAGWHKMEEKAVYGVDAALKSQVVFLEWKFSRVQPKRVNIACAPRGCCKFIKRDSLTRSSSATTTVTHRVCLSSWDLIHSSIFFFLLNFTSFGVLFTSVSIPFSHECILTPNICVPLLTQSSSRRLFITLSASSSSSHARDLMKNNMAIVSGPWRRGWIFFCYIKKSRLNRMDVIPC